MWGDPERAMRLDGTDPLVSFLFQVTGPAHIPWSDPVWHELLHGYNVWVHCQADGGCPVMERACTLLVQYGPRTSNLAALSRHVTRLVREFSQSQHGASRRGNNNNHNNNNHNNTVNTSQSPNQQSRDHDQVSAFSNRISLVGKARALSGALNLLRILMHSAIAESSSTQSNNATATSSNALNVAGHNGIRRWRSNSQLPSSQSTHPPVDQLQKMLLYKDREDGTVKDVGADLLDAVLQLICSTELLDDIPELYDCLTLALQLVTVLLSSQLYQPMQSSFQLNLSTQTNTSASYSFWTLLLEQASAQSASWSPRHLLSILLDWQLHRPEAPHRSIQYHVCSLAQQVVIAKGEKVASDGLYESHLVVQSRAPDDNRHAGKDHSGTHASDHPGPTTTTLQRGAGIRRSSSHHTIMYATRGVLELSSKLILLPFRLMSIAFGLWGLQQLQDGATKYDQAFKQHLRSKGSRRSRTRDVLWLSTSPVADMSTCLLLLLSNNERNGHRNAFRMELASLTDNRWDDDGNDLPDLPDSLLLLGSERGDALGDSQRSDERSSLLHGSFDAGNERRVPLSMSTSATLTANFEGMFATFGTTLHTEPSALFLYTLLQTSPAFASSIAVRSDLDTLVLPLLRTFYFATSPRSHVAAQHDFNSRATLSNGSRPYHKPDATGPASIRDCPFRSQSQIYVIIILLLLFSQDTSFGADAFRRVMVPLVPWYKERFLKDISLGSVLLLVLLRSLAFNLNRQNDAFLLSNCCAVLMNLSSSIVDLHDYAAMRLVSLTISSMKRYLVLRQENPNNDEDDLTTPTSMHGEAVRTLLCVLQHCLARKNINTNLHLVYALVYHQGDFNRLCGSKGNPFKEREVGRIKQVTSTAARIIEKDGNARTANKALKVLADNIEKIRNAVTETTQRKHGDSDDFLFTYEEEADPEIFFVPYVWEVIVCVLSSASIEWHKNQIAIFPLLDEEVEIEHQLSDDAPEQFAFARDVTDVV